MTTKKHKDISRNDQDNNSTHGWYVRVRFKGKNYCKFFSDQKCGGRYLSLLAAIAWRDETEKGLDKPRTNRNIVTVSNTLTGVVGVHFNEKLNRYDVSWVDATGKQEKTSVSIRKYGQREAFRIACKKRKDKEAERIQSE